MNQPFLSLFGVGARKLGVTVWIAILALLGVLGLSAPSQAQGFFTIVPQPNDPIPSSVIEGTGVTRGVRYRITLVGGVGGQTYRLFYRAISGPVDGDPSKPPAIAGGQRSETDFDGGNQSIDFAGAVGNNFKDVTISINSDPYDEGSSDPSSIYNDREFFYTRLIGVQNVSGTPTGPLPLIGSDPDPLIESDNDRVESFILDDDLPPILSVIQIPDQGPTDSRVSFADSFYPEGDSGQSNNVRVRIVADFTSGKTINVRVRALSGSASANTDFTALDTIVTIPINANTEDLNINSPAVPFDIPIIGDNLDEADESITVDIRDPNGNFPENARLSTTTSGNPFATTAIILDDDAPSVSIADTQVSEGDAGTINATFQVSLSSPSPQVVRIDYFTTPNSALQTVFNGLPADYEGIFGGSITFAPFETTKFISIKVNGDSINEGVNDGSGTFYEYFFVDLDIDNNGNYTSPPNPTLGVTFLDARGRAAIQDDDPLPQLLFSQGSGGGGGEPDSSGDVTINEPDLNGQGQPTQATANFVVSLSSMSGRPITVTYSTSDGTAIDGAGEATGPTNPVDYRRTTATLTFNPGEQQQVVQYIENDDLGVPQLRTGIPIFGDNVDETNETFFVTLSNPTNASILDSQAQATIVDNDGPFVSLNGGTVNGTLQPNVSGPEGDTGTTPFNFTVQLTDPNDPTKTVNSPQPITVTLRTSDLTATSPADYQAVGQASPFVLTFQPGENTKIVTVNVNGDIADERNETFALTVVSVTNAQNPFDSSGNPNGNGDPQAIGTIIDDDATPTISINDVSVTEGDAGQTLATFTVQLSAPTFQDVSFNYATADGTTNPATLANNDYQQRTGQLIFNAALGETQKTISIPVVGDTTKEADETFRVILNNVVNADTTSQVTDLLGIGTILNDDQDPPGVIITPTSVTTSESGTSDSFTVRLSRQPAADVQIQFSSTDTSEGLVSTGAGAPASSVTLTFTPNDFSLAQTVKVTGQDDNLVDGNITYLINSETAVSTDPLYQGLNATDVVATNVDDEVPGFQVTPISLNVSETGTTATFTVRLNVAPTATVTIPVSSSDPSEGTVDQSSLVFTPANGTTPQTVTVTGIDDTLRDGNQNYTIVLGTATSGDSRYNGLDPQDVAVTTIDNETPGVLITPIAGLTTSEAGTTDTFTIQLTSPPTAPVTITLRSSNVNEGTVTPTAVTFTSSNFNQPRTITVRGVDDNADDGDVNYNIITEPDTTTADPDYRNLNPADVSVTNVDNEAPGLIVNPGSLTVRENVGTTSFTVRLATKPSADVTVPVSSEKPGNADVNPATLTFTPINFSAPQTVTVTITDNLIDDGDANDIAQNFNIVLGQTNSADTNYDQLDTLVPITIQDNDTAGITISPVSGLRTREDGGGNPVQFSIRLNSQPTGSVTIPLSSNKPNEGTISVTSVTFDDTNFNTPQTVTITGVDDFVDDGDVPYEIVTGTVQSSDPKYGILNPVNVSVTNVDNDTSGVTVTPTTGLRTGEDRTNATFTVVLTSQPTTNVFVNLTSSDTTEGSPAPTRVLFNTSNWNTPQTITVRGVDDAIDDGDVNYLILTTITSADAVYKLINPADVQVTNVDNDTAGITLSTTGPLVTTEAGTTASFTIKLNSQPTSDVKILLSSSKTTEGTVSPASVTFTAANYSVAQTVTVTGVNDNQQDGHVNYSIVTSTVSSSDTKYGGVNPPDVAARNLDNDDTSAPIVAITSPKPNENLRNLRIVTGTASDVRDPNVFFVSGIQRVEITLRRFDNPATPGNEAGYYNPTTKRYEVAANPGTQRIAASYNPNTGTWAATLPVGNNPNSIDEGRYSIQAFAIDKSGNEGRTAEVNFLVDSSIPTVAITSPVNGTTAPSISKATGTASDGNGSGVKRVEVVVARRPNSANGLPGGFLASDGSFNATFDASKNRLPATITGGTGGNVNWTISLPTLAPATYTITAYAIDAANNTSPPATNGFTITGNGGTFVGNATYLISLPYMDSASINATTTPERAFSVPPTDPVTGQVNYRLQRYNPLTFNYADANNTTVLRRGEGYLLTPVRNAVRIKTPQEDPTRFPLPSTIQEFQIVLRKNPSVAADDARNGYNLIGNPFDPAVFSGADWLNSRVTANIGGQTFTGTVAEAANRQILDSRLFTFDEETGSFTVVTGNLLPFRGYFVRTFVDGVQVNLKAIKR